VNSWIDNVDGCGCSFTEQGKYVNVVIARTGMEKEVVFEPATIIQIRAFF
jgi:hypothetical protein